MPNPGNPTINLGSFSTTPPSGGSAPSGGMGTNLGNSGAVPYYDQWMYRGVVMGFRPRKTSVQGRPQGGGGRGVEDSNTHSTTFPHAITLTPFQLLQHFDGMSNKDYWGFKNQLVAAGFVSKDADPVTVRDAYQSILKDIQQMQHNGANVTFKSYVASLISKNGLDPKKIPNTNGWDPSAAGGSGSSGPKTYTNTSKSVYDLDPASAHLMLEQMLQQKLGRDPSNAEIQDFADAVKTRASADPSVSKTTYHTDGSGNTTSNTTTNSGFGADDAQLMAENRAKHAPDYKSYQAVSTYFPALMQALGATV